MVIKASLKMPKGLVLEGRTKNISFGGTFIRFEKIPLVEVGDYFTVVLFGRIKFTVKVIHFNEEGIGFQFDFILIKYYEYFKKMMLLNAADPDRLIKELNYQEKRCQDDV